MTELIPTIDFVGCLSGDEEAIASIAAQVAQALESSGFMKVKNVGLAQEDIDGMFELSEKFFSASSEIKTKSAYNSAGENFGYQRVGIEHLDPSQPFDIKETFTMRDLLRHDPLDPRWPGDSFRQRATRFYRQCLDAAYRIQRVCARVLNVEDEFFVQYHTGENVSLRLLFYPSTGDPVEAGQLGAGAHTDYGMLTLLFQHGVGGLEVQDADGNWHEVPPENDAIVINTGDLMERWTNGRFRSTPHRVQPKIGDVDRLSIAMFVDPDTATPVKVLDSCVPEGQEPRYPEITAGEHIQERIEASHRRGGPLNTS